MVHNDSQRDADNTVPDSQKSFLIIFACSDYYLYASLVYNHEIYGSALMSVEWDYRTMHCGNHLKGVQISNP